MSNAQSMPIVQHSRPTNLWNAEFFDPNAPPPGTPRDFTFSYARRLFVPRNLLPASHSNGTRRTRVLRSEWAIRCWAGDYRDIDFDAVRRATRGNLGIFTETVKLALRSIEFIKRGFGDPMDIMRSDQHRVNDVQEVLAILWENFPKWRDAFLRLRRGKLFPFQGDEFHCAHLAALEFIGEGLSAIADGGEWLSTHERVNLDKWLESESLRAQKKARRRAGKGSTKQANVAVAENGETSRPKRGCYDRDHTWLRWRVQNGMTPAEIRDCWNKEHPDKRIGSGKSGIDLVKKGIKRAKADEKNL